MADWGFSHLKFEKKARQFTCLRRTAG